MDYREINSLMAKCIRERNTPIAKSEEFREALINAENALRELKKILLIIRKEISNVNKNTVLRL